MNVVARKRALNIWTGPGVFFGLPVASLLVTGFCFGLVSGFAQGYEFLLWQLDQPILRDPVVWLLSHPLIGGDIGLSLVTHNRLDLSSELLQNPAALLSFALRIFAVEALTLVVLLAAAGALIRGGSALARRALAMGRPSND